MDLAAPVGTPVRAVARGRVSFAGRVAGRGVVAVELSGTGDPPLRTTYEPVTPSVKKGALVAPGEVLGALEPPTNHCGPTSCLHWGLLRGDTYLDPLSLLPPRLLRRGPSRLLSVPPTVAVPGLVPPGADPPLLVPLLPVLSGVGAGYRTGAGTAAADPAAPSRARAPDQPLTPRRAMPTAASVIAEGSSAAPSSIRRTAASTTP